MYQSEEFAKVKEDEERVLAAVSSSEQFNNMDTKKEIFNFLLRRSSNEQKTITIEHFRKSAQYACKWCKREYGLTEERIEAFVYTFDNIEECLQIMGGEGKSIDYIAINHPNLSCSFVEERLKRMLLTNETDYEEATPDRRQFSDFIIARGFVRFWVLDNLLKLYILKNFRPTAMKAFLNHKKLSCVYHLSRDAKLDEYKRFVECYCSFRRHALQQDADLKDKGVVHIKTAYYFYRYLDAETELDIYSKDGMQIVVGFPRVQYDLFNRLRFSDSNNTCLHTHIRLQQVETLITILRKHFDVHADIRVPDSEMCHCTSRELFPEIASGFKRLPTTADRPVIYKQPQGLMGRCLKNIRNWDWRARDLNGILPGKLIDYYFGSGNQFPYAENGF